MASIKDQHIEYLRQQFPTLQGSGDTYEFETYICGSSYKLKLTLGPSFPNNGLSLEFKEEVTCPMVGPNHKSICHKELQNFNGMRWMHDTIRIVINELNQCGVQIAGRASSQFPYASSPGSIAHLQSPGGLSTVNSSRPNASEWWEKMAKRIDDMDEGSIKTYLEHPEKCEELYNADPDVCRVAFDMRCKSDDTESQYRKVIDEYQKRVKSLDENYEKAQRESREVEQLRHRLTTQYHLYTKEELLALVGQRITELETKKNEIHMNYVNQSISAEEFSSQYMPVVCELEVLRTCKAEI